MNGMSLADLAKHIGMHVDVTIEGDSAFLVQGIAALQHANSVQISFLTSPKYQSHLATSSAGAVIIHPKQAHLYSGHKLIMDDPYLGYAIASAQFNDLPVTTGIHGSAQIAASAQLGRDVSIGPNASIGEHVSIGDGVKIGANSVVGDHSFIGEGGYLAANVSVYHATVIGKRVIIHSGAVIGADGFGFAHQGEHYYKIHQLGRVVIGDDVEIGANTCIDRGALDETQIGNGVKLDNQIQIAHNVVLGDNTAMAGCSAVAGSSVIGKNCTIAGAAVVLGHLTLVDNVHITAMSLITNSIQKPGAYSSGTGFEGHETWRKNVVRFKQLNDMAKQLKQLQKQVQSLT